MILKNVLSFKLKKSSNHLTSFAGIPFIAGLAESLKLHLSLNSLKLKSRARGYSPAEYILSLALMLIAGGEALDDIRLLKSDPGLSSLLGSFPAPNSLGLFLKRFSLLSIQKLAKVNFLLVQKLIARKALSSVTLDIDSSLIESYKKNANMTYKGFHGYNPLFLTVAELKLTLASVFRDGNASPQSNLISLLRIGLRYLSSCVSKFFLRSDSAAYQIDILNFCNKRNIYFTITADKDESVMDTIKNVPDNYWFPFEDGEIAHALHSPGNNRNDPVYRLVILRRPLKQPDLFEGHFSYHVIITNIYDWTPEKIIHFHRLRADASENLFKELKLGFGLSKLPSASLLSNAVFSQSVVLAYNLVQAFKYFVLPPGWESYSIKSLRFYFFRLAGSVSNHSRRLWLHISKDFPYFNIFEDAKYIIIGLASQFP